MKGAGAGEQGAGERRPYTKYWPVPFDDTIMERRCAMSSMLQGIQGETPEFLAIGHVTRDVHPDSGFSLGGTVTFAALTAYHLGLASAIVTCADPELVADLPGRLPEIGLAVRPSAMTTTFDNRYHEGFRTQYLRARGDDLDAEDVPAAWRGAPVVLLGPLAQELAPGFVSLFPRRSGAILAATPQGWLRRWDHDGRVWPTPWSAAETLLPNLDVLILSHDDLLPFADGNRAEADAILARWSHLVPLLVATDGRHGATLFQQGVATRFPAYATQEVDPTGAGDVFAAAFLTHLYKHHIPGAAVDFANCVASLSVEHEGTSGIPTMAQAMERVQARMER
ncbi:MAG: PfkB family carbohydrate kinase [Ktedonobacteraceae bacterium]